MLRRLTCIMPLLLLLACLSPEEQARQQAAAAATQEVADQIGARSKAFRKARTLLPNVSG